MKKVCKFLSALLIVFLLAAVAVLVLPRLFGVKMYSVLSGSMEPTYSTGDLIYAFPRDAEKIEVDDVISFALNNDGTVATHRVVEVDRQNKQFYTKGDANELSDGRPVNYENVLGIVKFHIPKVGYLIGYMNTVPGKIVTITIIIAIIILIMLLQTQVDAEREKEDFDIPRRGRQVFDEDRERKKSRPRREKKEKRQKQEAFRTVRKEPEEEPAYEETPVYKARPRRREEPPMREEVKKKEPVRRRHTEKPVIKPVIKPAAEEPKVRESKKKVSLYPLEDEGIIPVTRSRSTPLEADYKFQRLQVCYKMISLMETMWNDTMNEDMEAFRSDEPEIIDAFADIEMPEEGGEPNDETKNGYTVS